MKISEVKKLLEELEIKPLKSLGQNFLIDESIIQKICTYKDLPSFDRVIEIGPGLGSLTSNFEDFKNKVSLIELDRSLSEYWTNKGFDVHHQDALKFDWTSVGEKAMLISNLPYQISSRLLIELFCVGAPFDEMVLMFQKEVGERIKAEPEDKKQYGLLSIICQLGWSVRAVTKAPNRCFYPAPEIESVVLSFSKKPLEGLRKRKAFVNHLKLLFGARRKKMNGVFKKYKLEWPEELKGYLEMRPDQINAEEHLKLYKFVEENHV
ncbi:MAG: 16S rRNA (adenine(1518)-N(6)/adenine(1519)-N(6))-dimethyltransferase RsmA [Bdellovibrionales bacterium]